MYFFFNCNFHLCCQCSQEPWKHLLPVKVVWFWRERFLDVSSWDNGSISVWGEAQGGGDGGGVSIAVLPPHPANSDSAQRLFHLWPGPRNELWRAAASKNIRWLSLIIPRGYWDGWGKAFPRPPAERGGGKYLRSHRQELFIQLSLTEIQPPISVTSSIVPLFSCLNLHSFYTYKMLPSTLIHTFKFHSCNSPLECY